MQSKATNPRFRRCTTNVEMKNGTFFLPSVFSRRIDTCRFMERAASLRRIFRCSFVGQLAGCLSESSQVHALARSPTRRHAYRRLIAGGKGRFQQRTIMRGWLDKPSSKFLSTAGPLAASWRPFTARQPGPDAGAGQPLCGQWLLLQPSISRALGPELSKMASRRPFPKRQATLDTSGNGAGGPCGEYGVGPSGATVWAGAGCPQLDGRRTGRADK